MFCSFHQKNKADLYDIAPLEEQIFSGLTCILVQVAIFRPSPSAHYLNVTINNVVKVWIPHHSLLLLIGSGKLADIALLPFEGDCWS
jgi:hypothetical protein